MPERRRSAAKLTQSASTRPLHHLAEVRKGGLLPGCTTGVAGANRLGVLLESICGGLA